jgi:hypothetical protein
LVLADLSWIDALKPPLHHGRKGRSRGTSRTVINRTMMVNGTPTRTKSIKRYFPGTSTSVFTGDETGVINAADAANATVIAKG